MKFLCLSLLFTFCSFALAEEAVTINKSEPTISIRSFDPNHPPKDMPKLDKDEAAVTESVYGCGAQIEVETKSIDNKPVKTTIVAVKMNINLDVTEWLPKDTTPKIKAHEDGHRKISELYYENAEKAAKTVSQQYVGKQLDPTNGDINDKIKAIATECCQKYLGIIERPSQRAQELYDQSTDHGRNKTAENRAIKESVAQAQKENATTRAAQ